jgi:hypothetical protein
VSRVYCAVRIAHIAALLAVSLPARPATTPTAGDLARCAGIAAPDARLACYDGLAGRSADRAATAAGTAAPSSTPAAVTATPAIRAAPTTQAPAPTAPAPAVAGEAQNFGLTPTQRHSAPEGPAAIQARIAKIIEDRRVGRTYVILDNGQTWSFTDAEEDARLGPGDPVTIKHAALGSFLMTTSSRHTYHVRRTQ